jgi:NTP pyrophosphatase (non-canonical NTP hydrolase)
LVGEAGEVANKIKKVIRDKKIFRSEVEIASEIGDVLWYCAMLADYLDTNLGKIMEDNIDKLQSRKSRGTLGGSGDRR